MKAMIFAAGLGTRLRPLTNDRPKALVEVNGVPLLEHSVWWLLKNGITEIVVNVHHFGEQIIEFVAQRQADFGIPIHISDERGALLDTGGGLKKAAPFLGEGQPFVVCNADVITNLDLTAMLQFHKREQAMVTLAVRKRETSRYLVFDEQRHLVGWYNEKTNTYKWCKYIRPNTQHWAFSGIHIVQAQIFAALANKPDKFSIIDAYLHIACKQKIVAYPHDEDVWLDVGKPHTLALAEELLKNKGL